MRRKIVGTAERPRLTVFRSSKHIYAQLIDDLTGETLAAASSLAPDVRKDVPYGGNIKAAQAVGKRLAEVAKATRHHQGGVRSRTLSVSRPHQGAGRGGHARAGLQF